MVSEQDILVMVVLTNLDNEDYRPFWPTSYGSEMMWDSGYSQYTVSLLEIDDFSPRTIRLRLEVRKPKTKKLSLCQKPKL